MSNILQRRININLDTATEKDIYCITNEMMSELNKWREKKRKESRENPVVDWEKEDRGRKKEEPEKSQYIFTDWKKKVQNDIAAFESLIKTNPHHHYNNDNGSLYKIASDLGLNAYEFDILKRIARCRKKGQFEQDLQKIKDTVDLYLKEVEHD